MNTQNFIEQVWKGKTDWWRFFISFFIVILGWQTIGMVPIFLLGILYTDTIDHFIRASQDNFLGLGIPSNLYFFAMIFSFFAGLMFLVFAVIKIHQRKFLTVLTSRTAFDWKRFFYAVGIWLMVSLITFFVDYAMHPHDFTWNFKPNSFIVLLFISILFLPFQTSFEEVLFRGYFMQGIGGLVKNRWVPLLFTSVAFGLLHGFNPEVAKLGNILFLYYIGTGLLFGMVTLIDEGLELALGMHAANNVLASLLVTYTWGVFQTDALFVDHSEPNLTLTMFVPLLIVYPIVFFIFYKKYGWTHLQERLTGKIQKPTATPADEDNFIDAKV